MSAIRRSRPPQRGHARTSKPNARRINSAQREPDPSSDGAGACTGVAAALVSAVTAARLAARYPDAALLLTLPQEVNAFNCHDCAGRVGRLVRAGVAEPRIHILPIRSPGTHGEALAVLEFARRATIRRLVVVTSPYHTRRSLATFRTVLAAAGTTVGIEPASDSSPAQPSSWWHAPYDRWYVGYEWTATLYY